MCHWGKEWAINIYHIYLKKNLCVNNLTLTVS